MNEFRSTEQLRADLRQQYLNLGPEELGRRIGCTPAHITNLMKGRRGAKGLGPTVVSYLGYEPDYYFKAAIARGPQQRAED